MLKSYAYSLPLKIYTSLPNFLTVQPFQFELFLANYCQEKKRFTAKKTAKIIFISVDLHKA